MHQTLKGRPAVRDSVKIIVHGGAGSHADSPAERQNVLDEAAIEGVNESTPIQAVEAAINRLEASPRFNAGYGSVAQVDGQIRTDAGMMTSELDVGAVCSLQRVRHPVSVARRVLDQTPHVLLSGDHADAFADEFDLAMEADETLHTDAVREKHRAASPPKDLAARIEWVTEKFGTVDTDDTPRDHDTVGGVAVSDSGEIAAATSTGGRWFALAGRVGDTPQVGAGFYADPAAGASATGAGEAISKSLLSNRAVRYVADGTHPSDAAQRAVAELKELTDDTAGIVIADRDGNVGSSFNSAQMQTGTAVSDCGAGMPL